MWVRKLFQERRSKGLYNVLVKDLMLFDHEYFFKAFKMSPSILEELLSWIAPLISKSSRIRDVTGPSERLCITLWYLTSGDAQLSIESSFRVSPTTVSRIIQETCGVIWDELCRRGYLDVPDTEYKWKKIAKEFELRWNFPHCLKAIDGKHIVMQAPASSGSEYFQLGYAIDNNTINRPPPSPINNSEKSFPYVFVADDAFQMKPFMLKPFAKLELEVLFFADKSRKLRNLIKYSNIIG